LNLRNERRAGEDQPAGSRRQRMEAGRKSSAGSRRQKTKVLFAAKEQSAERLIFFCL